MAPRNNSTSDQIRAAALGMANDELRASLDPILKDDPISRLGFDPDLAHHLPYPGETIENLTGGSEDGFKASYLPPETSDKNLQAFKLLNANEEIPADSVVYQSNYAQSPDVLAHEFRHRGLEKLYQYFDKDPETFFDKYGEKTAEILQMTKQSNRTNEYMTEIGDNRDATWLSPGEVVRTMAKTITDYSENDDLAEERRDVYANLQRAAQDMLIEQGEEPSAQKVPDDKEAKGFFESVKDFFSGKFAEGGVVKKPKRDWVSEAQKAADEYIKQYAEGGVVSGRNKGRNDRIRERKPQGPRTDPFSLPMDANPNTDRRIPGELDDAGYYTYKTRSGKVYTVRPKEDQRTTRTKVTDWVEEGAPLPSVGQVAEVAKQIPGAMYDSVDRAVRGQATLGEVLGMAPTMQAAGAVTTAPAGSLRMGGARVAKPKENPLRRDRREIPMDEVKKAEGISEDYSNPTEFTGEAPYGFYSPIRQTVENMDFGKNNVMSGAAIQSELKRVLNQGGGIRNSELAAADIPLDPKKKYTKDEAMALVYENTWEVRPHYETSYSAHQRQMVADPVVSTEDFDGYVEIVLDANKSKGGMFEPSQAQMYETGTHYGRYTVAHARLSQRAGDSGDYLLVEEYQSDLFQKGAKPKEAGDPKVSMGDIRRTTKGLLRERLQDVDDDKIDKLSELAISRLKGNDNFGEIFKVTGNRGVNAVDNILDDIEPLMNPKAPTKDMPFNKPEEWLRLTVLSTVAEAQRRGLNTVAVPVAKDIAKYRYTVDANLGQVPLTPDQMRMFDRVYGKAMDKVLRQIEDELGPIKQDIKKLDPPKDMSSWRRLEKLREDLQEYAELADVSVEDLRNATPDELREIHVKTGLNDEALKFVGRDLFWYHQNMSRREGTKVRWLDISNLEKLNESEMRFAQGGLVDTLDSDAFRDYLDGGMYG